MTNHPIFKWSRKLDAFGAEAHVLLGTREGTRSSKVNSLELSRRKLTSLSIKQRQLLADAVTCIDCGVYGAAHVIAWAGYVDLLEEKLASDAFVKLHVVRVNWAVYVTLDDLRENISEYQIIEASRVLGLLQKSEMKSIHGLLAKRNECAHPSGQFLPGLNEAVGYVSEVIKRAEALSSRTL